MNIIRRTLSVLILTLATVIWWAPLSASETDSCDDIGPLAFITTSMAVGSSRTAAVATWAPACFELVDPAGEDSPLACDKMGPSAFLPHSNTVQGVARLNLLTGMAGPSACFAIELPAPSPAPTTRICDQAAIVAKSHIPCWSED